MSEPVIDPRVRPRLVFLGSGRFAVPILEALAADPSVHLAGVVTAPERPAGRGALLRPSPVGVVARAKWLSLLTPERVRDPDAVEAIRSLRPDVLVLADYGQLVPVALLELTPHGALNVHPSLLPRYRGASPIPAAILNGDDETGVSVIRMDAGIDTGPIVAQERFPLSGRETSPQLEKELARLGGSLLVRTIPEWLTGGLSARPQSQDESSQTRPLTRKDGRLDPARPAPDLERQVRAYQPWPGSFLETQTGRVVVWVATPVTGPPVDGTPPGTLAPDDDGLVLITGDGALRLDEVQPAGGRRMTGPELRRGRPNLVGSRVRASAIA